ncbi:Phosphoenolpyruvate-protein phosphotransferase [Botrimarina colliarenosi]|uniref:Phosphoenolpyruvate-protein phosphotransferase n=1 Tax=Botrimarina colliarenosi TaxID=2528001 RepID=A0A5C6ABE4_9BACT|nr:phosphoenolpyruvate--protein phosphotransferase [Botrimarina colliarenosi]TWT96730.1 Phosphoenolpyruvate-protein phosphotransferase [Botrimarina colliarenosi]
MLRLQGIAVSPGVAIGEALVVDNEGFRIPRRFLPRDAIDREIARLTKAIDETTAEINESRRRITERLGDDYGSIFSAHAQMVNDRKLRQELEELIRDRHYSAEYSVSRVLRRYAKVFQSLEGAYMAERANDIFDIEKRLLRRLLGEKREELAQVSSEVIVLARNLTPSETAAMKPEFTRGFATETGGPGSHTAIVAEGLGIPAVVGTGAFLSDVSGGEMVIIDGDEGLVILRPDEETLARYRHEVAEQKTLAAKLDELSDKACETLDGQRIQLLGNIEFPAETKLCLQRGVDGIGLYRTEFLFLTGDSIPTEEQHYAAYREVAAAMQGRPVVMRTLDLGADKLPLFPAPDDERNPFLGLRSIRLALKHVDIFRLQLRAILRATNDGDVRVMFPLVSNLLELRRARMVLADAMEDLEEEGVPFNRDIKVGMMVEVPSAVVMMERFVDEVDFFSIGTNDLVQYTLAVDRSNKDVASLYTSADPAVIRLVKMAIDAADAGGKPISLCGQMSGAPLYTMLLLGLGLRSLSVTPAAAPEVKRVVRSTTMEHCQCVAERVLTLESARDVKTYLREELSKLLPDQPI